MGFDDGYNPSPTEIISGSVGGGIPPTSPSSQPKPEECPPPPPLPSCSPPPPIPSCPPPPPPLPPSPPPPPSPKPPQAPSPEPIYSPPKAPPPHLRPSKPSRSPPKPPPPKPPKSPPPPPQLTFASPLLKKVYPVLQAFKKLVEFNGFNFSGKKLRLDNILDKLETVTIFHANSNNFLGSVPNVSNLKYLYELHLSNNKLTGDFPASVLKATNLTFLDLRFNTFSGSVPRQLFNLDLDVLFINNNKTSIQSRVHHCSLPHIRQQQVRFQIQAIGFTGPIPDSIGNIKYLQEVLFLNNQLTGCLPYQTGRLNQATVFDVGYNNLTGPIPYSFSCLDKIEQVNLARNKFYGTIPEIVCKISSLKNLSLSYNYFTQAGPKCRKLIRRNILDSMFRIPCDKNPNRVTLDQERLEEEKGQTSSLVSYGALNPDLIRNL
ncbi:hypothetical protein Bca52824_011102 [Brassica carinata]|uniref:Leucine-rich repeat family protein n=1 Tax=Brassica carinata TaxID=52824 RepID=A0A8X8B883_BRACI|nr:hypothetical protein Bca52824_011102 [Brassica carinata]